MKPTYHSLLICDHPGRKEIYLNGRTLGVIGADLVFTETADTQSLPTINAMQPHPFRDLEGIIAYLTVITASLTAHATQLAAQAEAARMVAAPVQA